MRMLTERDLPFDPVTGEIDYPEGWVTRENQEPDVLYVLPDGSCFVSPDGIGRYYFDAEHEAFEEYGDDIETEWVEGASD